MKIVIGGDVVPRTEGEKRFIAQDEGTFGDVAVLMRVADRCFVNLECALTHSENAIPKFGPNLKAHPLCADLLKKVGVTDVLLSNNHTFDFGIEGLVETVENLKRVGLNYTGIGENDTDSRKPQFIEQDGKRIAIINVCEHEYTYALPNRMGANPFDPFLTMQDIRTAKKSADHVIVVYHGAKEFSRYPSPRVRNLCHEMAHNGAGVILLQHSHCIGCYEQYEGCHILYGQGNFHFCGYLTTEGWNNGLLVELSIDDDIDIKFHPISIGESGITLAKGEEYHSVMELFERCSDDLKTNRWLLGWKEFCKTQEEYYMGLLEGIGREADDRKRQLFAHCLDCEAHTDVWREMFPSWNLTNK